MFLAWPPPTGIYSPYVIDTNSEGTRLFSAAYKDQVNVILGLNYTFKF